MINIKATILAAGDEEQFGGFFSAGWEYLESQLVPMGINARRGAILSKDVGYCMSSLSEATQDSDLVIILAAPRPRSATLVAALLAKGLGLTLSVSEKARECVQLHARRVSAELSTEDEDAFCAVPAGAVTLQNPAGFLQGYAITSRRQLLLVLPAAPSELQHSFASYVGELVSRFAANAERQTVTTAAVQSSPIAPIAPTAVHHSNPEPAPKSQADTVSAVCSALEQAGVTIAIAESGTSGALAQTLGSTRSSCLNPSDCFSGKDELGSLEISPELLSRYGTVSPQAAAALALAARSQCATSLGAAITCSSSKSSTAPVAYIAVTDGQKVWGKKLAVGGNAHQLRLGAVLDTLGILNLYAKGSGLPAGISAASAVDLSQPPEPVQSTGIVAKVGGKLSRMIPLRGGSPAPRGSEDEAMARTNLIQRLRKGKLTRNDKIRLGAVAMFLCIFAGSMIYIGSVFRESSDNLKLTDDLKNMFTSTDEVPDDIKEVYPKAYQTKFASLFAQNADVQGWIKIDNTKVDYPVVQSADNLFYERRDFTRASNQHGIPFLDFRVDNRAPSTNTVIYAHNMNDGQMFGELLNYKSLAYYKENPIVQYDSVYREGDYKIFGIVLCKKDDPEFNYHNFIDKENDKDMTEYVTKIRERSLINTGVDVRTDDELLTLSTCDYDFKSATGERIARFVVFARRVREGEGLEVDTSKATLNMNPVMPKEWYDTLARQQDAERKKHEEQQAAEVNKKWLTANELATLSVEEQKTVAASREADAKKYLTGDEASWMDIDEMVYTIRARKKEFVMYLTSSEQSSLSLSERIDLSADRSSLAREWLSDDEIASAGKWSRIEALIKERQKATTAVPDEAKWLTAEEIRTLSVDDKNYTIADRKAQAIAAGVTDAEIASTKTWTAMQQLIASKSKTTPEQYIKQNPQWLDDRDSGLSVDELKSLVARRKQDAKDAGLSSSEIAKHRKWETLEAAINAANATKGEAAQIKELVTRNPAWLSGADTGGKTLAQVQSLLADRQKQATDVGLNPAAMTTKTWSETKAAIEKKKAENEQNAAAKEQERKDYIAAHLPYLNDADKGKTLAELKPLVEGRIAQAQRAGVDVSGSPNWTESDKLIKAAQNPPTPPVVPPVDPPVVPPVDPPVVPPVDPPVVPPVDPPVVPTPDPETPPTSPSSTPDPSSPSSETTTPPTETPTPPAETSPPPPSDNGGGGDTPPSA